MLLKPYQFNTSIQTRKPISQKQKQKQKLKLKHKWRFRWQGNREWESKNAGISKVDCQ